MNIDCAINKNVANHKSKILGKVARQMLNEEREDNRKMEVEALTVIVLGKIMMIHKGENDAFYNDVKNVLLKAYYIGKQSGLETAKELLTEKYYEHR